MFKVKVFVFHKYTNQNDMRAYSKGAMFGCQKHFCTYIKS